MGELRAAGWTPHDLALPERGRPLLTRRTALLVGAPLAVWAAALAAESSTQVVVESIASFVLTVAGFLALMLLPQLLTLGRVSFVSLHEELHALALRAAGVEQGRISVRVRNPFGGSCMAEQFVLRRGEYLRMALAPALVMGAPLVGAVITAFLLGWPGVAGVVVRYVAVTMLVWHVAGCWTDFRSARHVLRAGKDAYADVRLEGGTLKVRAWTPASGGAPGDR